MTPRTLLAVAAALHALIGRAAAEPSRPPAEPPPVVVPHAGAGFEIAGGGGMLTSTARAYAGIAIALGSGDVRPTIGVGVTAAAGALRIRDRRALDGTLSLSYVDAGPTASLGLRWARGGSVDNHAFVTVARLWTDLDDRLAYDAVPGVGGRHGVRATLGISWAGHVAALLRVADDTNWLLLAVPQQVEVTWLRGAGSDRYGITASWGI